MWLNERFDKRRINPLKFLFCKKSFNKLKKGRSGFTFIEVVMSILITAVIAILIAFAMPTELLISRQTEDISKASYLAQGYIENVKQQLSNLTSFTSVVAGKTPPIIITNNVTANGYFNVSTNVSFVGPFGSFDSLKQIEVKFAKTGNTNTLVDLSTVIAKPNANLGS